MRKKTWIVAVTTAVAALMVGCAEPPKTEIDAAHAALDAAKQSQSAEYAAEELSTAEEAIAELNDELTAQTGKLALVRNYDRAKELAAAAAAEAQSAAAAAQAEKARLSEEATSLLAETRDALAEVRVMLENAPRGKGAAADLAVLGADLTAAESSLADVERSLDEGELREALVKAEMASSTVAAVRTAVTNAMTAQAGSRRG